MQPLDASDHHHLLAAEGWFELGNATEAAAEWDRLSSAAQRLPEALEIRWQILARAGDWDCAVAVAEQLVTETPDLSAGWLHRAYALRRSKCGGLEQAWAALYPAAEKFPTEHVIAYNLACYGTQMGRLDEGWEWFLRALQISSNPPQIRQMALKDDDLRALWDRIRGLQ